MKSKRILASVLMAGMVLSLVTACRGNAKQVINPKLAVADGALAGTMGNQMTGTYSGLLGYGYDVATKAYFNSDDVNTTKSILDMNALLSAGLVYSAPISKTETQVFMGTSLSDYQQSVATTTSLSYSYGLFSKVKADFSLSTDMSAEALSKNVYIKDQVKIERNRQFIDTSNLSVDDLKGYLTESVSDILSHNTSGMSAADKNKYYATYLFPGYGTHVMIDVILGGRLDLNYVYKNTQSKFSSDIRGELDASYKGFGVKVSGSLTESEQTKAADFVENSSFTATRVGGRTDGDYSSYAAAKASYPDWATSIDSSNSLELIDVGDNCQNSLVPIWELAPADKRQDIQDAYWDYVNKAGGLFQNLDDKVNAYQQQLAQPPATYYISNIYVGSASTGDLAVSDIESQISHSEPGATYSIVRSDLNAGVSGDYIYVGYTYTTDKSKAVTDMKVEWWNKDSNAPDNASYGGKDYACIRKDLNKNAGGKFIYIYYTKNASAGDPLKQIGVEINGAYSFGNSAAGWTSVIGLSSNDKTDCNMSAGGPYIYLWFTR